MVALIQNVISLSILWKWAGKSRSVVHATLLALIRVDGLLSSALYHDQG